jgi:pyruvate dehydrogenase E2 component (dihydrolipoamide acetyltransferase)
VTHHDEADVTVLEAQRKQIQPAPGLSRPSLLAFCVKAVVASLRAFPQFNASLDAEAGVLVLKKYFHIGIAIDTPKGLVVAVIQDCDKKSPAEIAAEIASKSRRAREKGLPFTDMVGGCFTISSLGADGGTAFTPIINAPEVAILGLSRLLERPGRGADNDVIWRMMLPLSLSYDHRVINGVDAARFVRRLCSFLGTGAADAS